MEKEASEIVKLTERVAKDPKSKLFVPLAEEYRKIGDIEMAIYVLTEGLKNNPGYVTARSTLGRLYLEQGDLASAQKELEEVIKVIPDNLLAQRKLGDIYVLQDKKSEALQRYKACLALNPDDKDLTGMVADLEAGHDIARSVARPKVLAGPPAANKPSSAPVPVTPKTPEAGPRIPLTPSPEARPVEPKASSFIVKTPSAQPEKPENVARNERTATGPPVSVSPSAQPTPVPIDDAEIVEEIVELEPLDQIQATGVGTDNVVTEVPEIFDVQAPLDLEPPINVSEVSTFDLSEPGTAAAEALEDQQPPVPWESVHMEAQQAPQPTVTEETTDDISTNTLAELYLAQGFYDKAIEIYQGILADHPDNETLRDKLAMIMAKAGLTESSTSRLDESAPRAAVEPSKEVLPGFSAGQTTEVPEHTAPEADTRQAGQPDRLMQPQSTIPPMPPGGSEEAPQGEATQSTDIPNAQTVPQVKSDVYQDASHDASLQGPLSHTARRKETLDRLEHWLKNIMKEKP
jgi:tetratricopeptide (TPR) repeat protein